MKQKIPIIAFIFFLTSILHAQWVQVGALQPSGRITSAVSNGNDMFVSSGFLYSLGGSPGGVFHSTDDGISWEDVTKGLTNIQVSSLLFVGNDLFAGTYGGGVFRTSDKGANWIHEDIGLNNALVTSLIVVGSNLFAGTNGQGVFRSTDNGSSWVKANAGLTNVPIRSFTSIGSILFLGTYGYPSGGKVFRSSDNGQSWSIVHSSKYGEGAITTFANKLFAILDGIYTSSDSGATWIESGIGWGNMGWPYDQFFAISGNNIMYCNAHIHDEGIYLSTDSGLFSWNWMGYEDSYGAMVNTSKDLIAFGTNSLYRSTDHGITWTTSPGMPTQAFNTLATQGQFLFAGASSGIYRSPNDGISWINVDSIANRPYTLLVTTNGIFAGCLGNIRRSTDNGNTWVSIDSGITDKYIEAWSLDTLGNDLFVADAFSGDVYRSANNGDTWMPSDISLPSSSPYAFFTVLGNDLFVGSAGDGSNTKGEFRSVDGGSSWFPCNNGLPDPPYSGVIAMTTFHNDIFVSEMYTGSGIYRSSNHGALWTMAASGLPQNEYARSFIAIGNTFFAGTNTHGVYITTNSGDTWNASNEGLPSVNSQVVAFTIKDKNIFACVNAPGLQGSVWRRSLSDFGISDVKNPSQSDPNISLSPNPTTGIITVHNSSANILHFTVSSILGESVLELEHPNAPDFTLDLSKLPQGTYFARFSLAGEIVTKKVIKN